MRWKKGQGLAKESILGWVHGLVDQVRVCFVVVGNREQQQQQQQLEKPLLGTRTRTRAVKFETGTVGESFREKESKGERAQL